ncbi:hypothetical protein CROQUDRAFT_65138 [Cronartium quercuum f. sp. fusiforme G11]|uniref:Secreted protein n=1 Tax=Cronartium quercuum f. sp. fusiforme G11 TaxID=708437 RepID=A0A9P6TA72_9BASI|nr:hypothetical protein CROQUDRAFT_65138 [Cronartium quercuum f. sp. fusiforme G11]
MTHSTSHFFLFLSALLTSYLINLNSVTSISILSVQPKAVGVTDVCGNTLACSLLDTDWPTTDFTCGQKKISATSFMSARQYMLAGSGKSLQKAGVAWPSKVAEKCKNIPKGIQHVYDNGLWKVFYLIDPICHCDKLSTPKPMPNCREAITETNDACNVAQFYFCAMELNGVQCTH